MLDQAEKLEIINSQAYMSRKGKTKCIIIAMEITEYAEKCTENKWSSLFWIQRKSEVVYNCDQYGKDITHQTGKHAEKKMVQLILGTPENPKLFRIVTNMATPLTQRNNTLG